MEFFHVIFNKEMQMSITNKYWAISLFCLLFSFNSLAQGDVKKGKLKTMACMGCHGPDGNSFILGFPSLASQPADYITKQIQDFKSGERQNTTMTNVALGINDDDSHHIAAYYQSQIKTPVVKDIAHLKTLTDKNKLLALGKKLYDNGNPNTGQAACFTCHGINGNTLPGFNIPTLANQQPKYLISTLKDFKNRKRTNDVERAMRRIVDTMSNEEIEAVSYYASYLTSTLDEKK